MPQQPLCQLLTKKPDEIDAAAVRALVAARPETLKERFGSGREPPLVLAARAGRYDIVDILTAAGADPRETDAHNITAAGWCHIIGKHGMKEYLDRLQEDRARRAAAEKAAQARNRAHGYPVTARKSPPRPRF